MNKFLYLLILLAAVPALAQTYVEPGPAVQLLGGRGGTLTGPLYLFEDPLAPKEAVTLEYLNSVIAGIVAGTATQANWTATSGGGVVLNKPTLAAVATSGSYTDLSNKPTIPAATAIDSQTGAFLFMGPGVSHTGTTYTFNGGSGGSMTWPSAAGLTVYNGSNAWGTSIAAPSSAIVGTTDTQTLTNKTIDGVSPTTMGFVNPTSSIQTQLNGKQASLGFTPVANTLTINGHALSSNVVVSASDLSTGTLSHALLPALLTSDIPTGINITGTAANLSGTPALPSGTTAITQTAGDSSTKLATDAFVFANSLANPMTAAGDMLYGGTAGAVTRLAGPTVGSAAYNLCVTPSSGVATAPNWCLAGIGGRSVSGTTDTIVATDRGGTVNFTSSSATASAFTSPATLGNNFDVVAVNTGSGTVTFTLGAGNFVTAAGTSTTLTMASGFNCALSSPDNINILPRCSTAAPVGGVSPGVGIPNSTGSAWATPIFYVDANSPSSCTVSSVSYTTAFDCAFAKAAAWISSGSDSGQYNATLLVGSNGLLTTNVGIQEPTATSNHGTVNIIGDGVGASVLKINTSLASGVCMATQPPEATALNYATLTISGLTLDANGNADCIMQINGARNSDFEHILGKNVRAGSGNIGFQFGPSSASTSTVFETFVDDVKLEGTGGGYNPAIITCTVSSGNPVCTISDAGSYPTGTFSVQVHGVGNGSGPCSVYPTWTTTGTTTLTGLTATGGTCVAPLYVSVTPAPKVDYNFLFGPGFTDSTVKDIRAVESSVFAGIKVTGHPNTFVHPHCYVGQYACVEDYGSSDFYGLESDSVGGYAVVVEGTGSRFLGLSQIYNSFTRYAGSSLIYVDQGTAAGTSISTTVSGVGCNGNRQGASGYHNLVIGTGLPYTNTSSAGGAQDAGYAVPAGVQMDNILDCSSSPTVNTVSSHIGTYSIPALKSTTGTRYLCVDTSGNFVSQATACSGT